MALVLKFEGYPTAVVAAFAIHGVLLYFILSNAISSSDFVDVEKPAYVSATTIKQNPQKLRRLENIEQQRQNKERADRAAREAAAERARESQRVREREAKEASDRADAERQQREQNAARAREQETARARQAEIDREAERLRREQRDRAARDEQVAREAEATRQAAAQRQAEQAAADNENIQSYTAIIHDTVANNWLIPPSARNGMVVVVRIRLVPTGEVISADVLKSSGDPAFDRSALQAVGRAERFPELQQMPNSLFEGYFRTVNLQFRPEDLLR